MGAAASDPVPGEGSTTERAGALLEQLRSFARSQAPTLPGWLSWADGAGNVTSLAKRLLEDGRISADDVEHLVRAAYDHGEMTEEERAVLVTILRDHAPRFDPPARRAFAAFLGVEDPKPA